MGRIRVCLLIAIGLVTSSIDAVAVAVTVTVAFGRRW